MIPSFVFGAAAALTGCGGETILVAKPPELVLRAGASEAPLTAVGETAPIAFTVEHTSGPAATLLALEVQPILGDAFAVTSTFPIALEPDASVILEATFGPLVPGVALSRFTLVSNGDIPRLSLDYRGEGGAYAAQRWPDRLDFGRVVGTKSATVYLENTGDLPTQLEAIDFGAATGISTTLALPTPIVAGAILEVPITVATEATLLGEIAFELDNTAIDAVEIVANSCAYGNAADFDFDADGVSTCAGDCDDNAASVFPGAVEVANGLDEDCDGVVDEGTTAFDDDRDGVTEEDGDCDDADPTRYPGAVEQNNGVDDDCDGVTF